MKQTFKALADSTRRKMLDRLLEQPGQTLNELVEGLGMTRQSATRHLSVLETADLVKVIWQGREKLHYLNPVPISEIRDRWIDRYSAHRTDALQRLKQALEQQENS